VAQKHKQVKIVSGGKHVVKAVAIKTNQAYPLPLNHPTVSKRIVKAFRDWLVENNVCTIEEFDERVK